MYWYITALRFFIMAFPMMDLLLDVMETNTANVMHEILKAQGLSDAIDIGMLDDDDVNEMFGEIGLCELANTARARAMELKGGWASLQQRKLEVVATPPPALPADIRPDAPCSKKVAKITAACSTFAARFLGNPKAPKRPRTCGVVSLASLEATRMEHAKTKVHDVFLRHAVGTPRFIALNGASDLMWDMQKDTYRLKSRSARVVARRANMFESFFLDLGALKWSITGLDQFMVAAWVRGRVQGGCKSASSSAKQVLLLVQAATDVPMHITSPLVASQLQAPDHGDGPAEPPAKAKELSVEVVIKLERLVTTAPTPQLRCFCGFMALLASSSLRASDAVRTRSLSLTPDALTGVSRMKTKKCWTRWHIARRGFSNTDWVEKWMAELREHNLPGKDFLLYAASATMDSWLPRPAEYDDIRRTLHLILVTLCGMSTEQAAEYNPHGFRHLLLTMGQQLRTLGVVAEADLERLGHWCKGSSMVRDYDSSAGVSELAARASIVGAAREGWRPVESGMLPQPLPATPAAQRLVRGCPMTPLPPSSPTSMPIVNPTTPTRQIPCVTDVLHTVRQKWHLTKTGSGRTLCGMWACGTIELPSKDARFADKSVGYSKCRPCSGSVGKARDGVGKARAATY